MSWFLVSGGEIPLQLLLTLLLSSIVCYGRKPLPDEGKSVSNPKAVIDPSLASDSAESQAE